MAFVLTPIDQEALNQVSISIFPDEVQKNDFVGIDRSGGAFVLDSRNLQFPPLMTKDSKAAVWEEKQSGAYEPFKVYKMSNARAITIELQYVTGGLFTAEKIHSIIGNIRAYFYYANAGATNGAGKYPVVTINKFYGIIPNVRSTWRMMSVDVKRSKEMVKSGDIFYSLKTDITIGLESASQIAKEQNGDSKFEDADLVQRPQASFF